MGSIEPFKPKPLELVGQESAFPSSEEEVSFDLPKESGLATDHLKIQNALVSLKKNSNSLPKVLNAVVESMGSEGKGQMPPGTVIVTAGLISPDLLDLSRTLRALFHRAVEDPKP